MDGRLKSRVLKELTHVTELALEVRDVQLLTDFYYHPSDTQVFLPLSHLSSFSVILLPAIII